MVEYLRVTVLFLLPPVPFSCVTSFDWRGAKALKVLNLEISCRARNPKVLAP